MSCGWLSTRPGRRDAGQLSALLQVGDRGRARVAHRGAQAADELVGDAGQRAPVGHLALDALGDELVVGEDVVGEVAVAAEGLVAALLHRAQRAHAAVGLVLLAVHEDELARGLLDAGEQPADHHGVGAGDQGLGDVAGVLQAAVGDDRHAGRAGRQPGLVDGADLRDADAGDDAGGADGARADADLDRVDTGVDQRLRAGAGGDVAADDLDAVVPAEVLLHPGDHVEHGALVAVGGVDDEHVDAGVDEQPGALVGVLADAERGADDEPAVGVLGGERVLVALDEVLDGDQPAQPAGRRRPAAASRSCACDSSASAVSASTPDRRGDQRHRRHDVADEPAAGRSRTACRGW